MFLSLLNQTRVVDGKTVRLITHNGCPVLAWQASNLIIRMNAKGERMPDKGSAVGKVDAMVALLMAFSERLYHEEQFPEATYQPGEMFA
jgi:phage terminase large subunit-like protein